jgi:hypothetical protein
LEGFTKKTRLKIGPMEPGRGKYQAPTKKAFSLLQEGIGVGILFGQQLRSNTRFKKRGNRSKKLLDS